MDVFLAVGKCVWLVRTHDYVGMILYLIKETVSACTNYPCMLPCTCSLIDLSHFSIMSTYIYMVPHELM